MAVNSETDYGKKSINKEDETIKCYFNSCMHIQLTIDTISSQLDEAFGKIINSFEKFLERGSGFVLKEINEMQLDVAKYNPLRGSSYFPLPQSLDAKKSILNIQNFNDENVCSGVCLLTK